MRQNKKTSRNFKFSVVESKIFSFIRVRGIFHPNSFFENKIVQRTLYLPSAVGQPISHLDSVRTVRRIRNEGDDRQKN